MVNFLKTLILKIYILLLIFFITSCCKEGELLPIHSDCIQMKTNAAFITQPFKEGYTIQFPNDFMGTGLQKSPFISFNKEKNSDIKFYYVYNSDIFPTLYFGNQLPDPIPDQLQSPSQLLTENLALKKEFCLGNSIEAILYYSINTNTISYGKLYMKYNDKYYEGLNVTFRAELFDEVVAILKTIQKQ